jgi:hypothetical protein
VPLGVSIAPAAAQDGEQIRIVTLTNTGSAPALNAKLTLLDNSGVRILPVFYSDNYVALLPGETRRIEIRSALAGPPFQRLEVSGWNVQPAIIGFVGSYVLRLMSPGKILAGVAVGAITLILISASSTGALSGYSLLAIGLMNSIMFPTIFGLACEKLGARAADGSGIINIAIFGGAVVPLLTGFLADQSGSLAQALAIPAICYAIIAAFGVYARRPAPE